MQLQKVDRNASPRQNKTYWNGEEASLIWQQNRAVGGFLIGVAAVAIYVSVIVYGEFPYGSQPNDPAWLLAILQIVITLSLLGYAAFSPERRNFPRSGGYDVALTGGWLGLVANAFVIGGPALLGIAN